MEKREIKIAIAGNPNSGKSTIFNALTGGNVAVGNWPGVTVEKCVGCSVYQGHRVTVVDLPGTYALDAWTLDERIARAFLLEEKPDAVVAVVDAANLERNLYLVIQLLEMGARLIIALNMMDIAQEKGIEIDTARLERILRVQVVPTVAAKGEGIEELRRVIHDFGRNPLPHQPLRINYGDEIETAIARLANALTGQVPEEEKRWWALKILEGDNPPVDIPEAEQLARTLRHELAQRHKHDAQSAIVERRYGFIRGVLKECVRRRPEISRALVLSETIDAVVLNRWLGVPIFFGLMALTFYLVFALGTPLAELIGKLFDLAGQVTREVLAALTAPDWLTGLITEGLIPGIGTVLQFLPNIVILYLVISLMEDSGYMARAAFVMDRFMHIFGLHGKSFIPMIMGFGCNVPAILATRTLENRKDRILTVLVNPFMSCSARLPVYLLFTAAFFSRGRFIVLFSLYLLGIILAVITARLFRWLFFRAEEAPLIMELPPYHSPSLKTVLRPTWFRTWLFIRRAGTVIAPAVVIIWLLGKLPWGVTYASRESILGKIGTLFAPLLKPAGFGYWWAAVSLIAGVVAKEVVVGTMATIHSAEPEGLSGIIHSYFTPLSAYAFMVMSLLYIPCIATFAAIRRELGWRWAIFTAGWTLALGWLTATTIYQIGSVFL